LAELDRILIDNASPQDCEALMLSIKKGVVIERKELEEKARLRGVTSGPSLFRNTKRLIDLGILEFVDGKKNIALTEMGAKCKDLLLFNSDLYYEFLHHLHISCAFKENKERYFRTYYLITKKLFETGTIAETQKDISTNIRVELEEEFGESGRGAIDKSSVSKVCWWLAKLKPDIFSKDSIANHRSNVTHEAMMLSITSYYEKNHINFGSPIMLDRNSAREMSIMGFIDESYFIRNVENERSKSQLISIGHTVDGKSLLMNRPFKIGEII
jgi:hypothetical protein